MSRFVVSALNPISPLGTNRLPADRYELTKDAVDPDVILVRSADMHKREFGPNLKAVGRAGAGVNNIPIATLTARGIPVFNTPGANANAVKELVIAGLLLACRHICEGWEFARTLSGTDDEISKAVEAGKKSFAGFELPGRVLAVIGLGAIGRQVANAGVALGMSVVGFDPGLTVEGAWQLSASVRKARTLDEVLKDADFVTIHVPLGDATRQLINADRLRAMKDGVVLLNFAREGVVDEHAIVAALDSGKAQSYISDFPTALTSRHKRCVTLPHLGASTAEAEDNCAVQVVDQVREFLERGNVRNAVNFPEVYLAASTAHRLVCAHANVPNMLSQISEAFGRAGVNIHDMVNMSRGDLAYTAADLDAPVPAAVRDQIAAIPGMAMTRAIAIENA